MVCNEVQPLLHAYVDDELELTSSFEIEEHAQSCAVCAAELARLRELRSRIQSANLHYRTPAAVRERVLQSLGTITPPDSDQPQPISRASRNPVTIYSSPAWRWWAIAASIGLSVFAGWAIFATASRSSTEMLLAQETVASHVRSLMADHLTDVASSSQHTVKPWFAGRLDFSPPVKDLAAEGFPLVGGRLDYVDQRPVAALVYKRREHTINLFLWPIDAAADDKLHESSHQGYHTVHWSKNGFAWWAVSDLNAEELRQFAALLRSE
jgi:anti-sigma factor RsiW